MITPHLQRLGLTLKDCHQAKDWQRQISHGTSCTTMTNSCTQYVRRLVYPINHDIPVGNPARYV